MVSFFAPIALGVFEILTASAIYEAGKAGKFRLQKSDVTRTIEKWAASLPEEIQVDKRTMQLDTVPDPAMQGRRTALVETIRRSQIPAVTEWYDALRERFEEVVRATGQVAQSFFLLPIDRATPYLQDLAQALHDVCCHDLNLLGPTVVRKLDKLAEYNHALEEKLEALVKRLDRFSEQYTQRHALDSASAIGLPRPQWRPLAIFQMNLDMRNFESSMDFLNQFVARGLIKANLTERYREISCLVFPSLMQNLVELTGETVPTAVFSIITGDADLAGHFEHDLSLYLREPQFQQWEEEKRISREIAGWKMRYDLPFQLRPYVCHMVFDRQLHEISMEKAPDDDQPIHCREDMTTSEALVAFYKLMRNNRGIVEVFIDGWHSGFSNLLKRTIAKSNLSIAPMRVNANNPDEWDYLPLEN